jgi:hypothetical protein
VPKVIALGVQAQLDEVLQISGDRVISEALWPTRSSDLTVPDSFLWGLLTGKVSTNKPHTIDSLKANIRQEIVAIPTGMLQRVFASL